LRVGGVTSITDIALRAGVSVASVTRVLDGSKEVRLATRERVLRAVMELQDAAERPTLDRRLPRSGTIGFIVSDVQNPSLPQIVASIENISYGTKRRLVLCNSDEDPERERGHLSDLVAQGVDGIITLPVGATVDSIAPFIHSVSIVCLDRRIPGLELDLAISDNRLGSDLAVRHLVELGHSRIALIATHHETLTAERVGGFLAALAALGIAEHPEYVRRGGDARQHSGYEQTLHLLRLAQPPTAILVANHLLMLGAMSALRDRGLRTPEDISLVGFDETPWSRLLDPPLTTVALPANELGTAAAHLLIDRLDRQYTGRPREVMLPPELIVRASTCAPAADSFV